MAVDPCSPPPADHADRAGSVAVDATTEPVTSAVLAIVAARAGQRDVAEAHLDAARTRSRVTARRERQVIEIAALVLSGAVARAGDLALLHLADFPADAALVTCVRDVPPPFG